MVNENSKSLKPILEAARRIHFTTCAASLFHHFLYQCLYFGDEKLTDGEAISYTRLCRELHFDRKRIAGGLKHLKDHNILFHNEGEQTKFGFIYHVNTNISTWLYDYPSGEMATKSSGQFATHHTLLPNPIAKPDLAATGDNIFEKYVDELCQEYQDVKFDDELAKFYQHYDGKKLTTTALLNWMQKAREYVARQPVKRKNGNGKKPTRNNDPDKYIKGKYGHMVRR